MESAKEAQRFTQSMLNTIGIALTTLVLHQAPVPNAHDSVQKLQEIVRQLQQRMADQEALSGEVARTVARIDGEVLFGDDQ